MDHVLRIPHCPRPGSARKPDRCWPRRPSAAPRRTRRGDGRATLGLAYPVAGPVGASGAVAVKAGEDVEGVGSGHVVVLECVDRCLTGPREPIRHGWGLAIRLEP